ncbi:protein of unknown function [Candidatus Hydrogenisulfobacillus filiaventi]|uniref:ACT domain-containing protein n=1 Tax=Candidatus Hydrogenisulfobacillus filiaventi TaxID=2707344 RepID=A0A6F8ZE84_9FIRM|nr:hypothetical protein [Bacillota bacterium]CAB1128316.1 protein of unknown function [Candidatus Hydrogenisulfobacillus filiaventi]
MAYTVAVEFADEPGAVARLVILLNQRNLQVAHLSVHRLCDGYVEGIIGIDGDPAKAQWTLGQLTRLGGLRQSRILDTGPAERCAVRCWAEVAVPAGEAAAADAEGVRAVREMPEGEAPEGTRLVAVEGHLVDVERWAQRHGGSIRRLHQQLEAAAGAFVPPAAAAAKDARAAGQRRVKLARARAGHRVRA